MVKKGNSKKIRNNKVKKGGAGSGSIDNPNYNSGGPDGDVGTLVEDIWGTVLYTIGSITSAVRTITDTMQLGPNIGAAASNPATPNPDDVDIPQL